MHEVEGRKPCGGFGEFEDEDGAGWLGHTMEFPQAAGTVFEVPHAVGDGDHIAGVVGDG